jgi:uncharacterized protein
MATAIFVNLPVKNLDKSKAFFTKLRFKFNPQFTNEAAACMIMAENIYVMLLTEEKFKLLLPRNLRCEQEHRSSSCVFILPEPGKSR